MSFIFRLLQPTSVLKNVKHVLKHWNDPVFFLILFTTVQSVVELAYCNN